MNEIVEKGTDWLKKRSSSTKNRKPLNLKALGWRPARFSGIFKFRKSNSVQSLIIPSSNILPNIIKNNKKDDDADFYGEMGYEYNEKNYPTLYNQFNQYCRHTTMHGFRYIMEKKRNIFERFFWICWCIFGISAAMYMMSKIWQRWADSPVITSVASTNYPVTNIVFPAITICTVNKAVNEKLIIQGCRYNKTISEMRIIISTLVDPEGRNNDNDSGGYTGGINYEKNMISPETALKFLRLVAPKCQDYLLTCRWNSQPAACRTLFRLVLTDTGYCCSFNSVESKVPRKTVKSDEEVRRQEMEFDFLQKAVWEYTDRFRAKNNKGGQDSETNSSSVDSYTCSRVYDDDLFPGICKYIAKCRENPVGCKLEPPEIGSTPPPTISAKNSDDYPFKAVGSGRSRGLTLMLDTLRCDTVPTDSFKGLRVYVHHPEEFPSVGEKGFLVQPGMETQVSVIGTDTYSTEALRAFNPTRRGCYFSDEFPLKYYEEYSRSSCIVECENQFIYDECQCNPYYSPGNYSVCSVTKMKDCVRRAIVERKIFSFKSREAQDEKSCTEFCLPACNETFYDSAVTTAIFPNQPEPNMTKVLREGIADGHVFLNDIAYVSASISLLRIFFRESSILQYKRDELFTWEDFVSNLGGVMGLCLGFSLLSLIEVIYFFSIRLLFDRQRLKKANEISHLAIRGKF